MVDAFVTARLLVATSDGGASPTVRLAHEALINRWQRARDQLANDRRDLETRMLVERQFSRWCQSRSVGPSISDAVGAHRFRDRLEADGSSYCSRKA